MCIFPWNLQQIKLYIIHKDKKFYSDLFSLQYKEYQNIEIIALS